MASVAVVIPTFNRQRMVVEAIESALAQSFTDFVVIVVDDGSTDGTRDAVTDLSQIDSRVRYQYIEHSGYPGAVRNVGVELEASKYVAFLDSDDIWKPEKLERQMDLHRQGGFRISHTRELWLRGKRIISQAGQKHRREGNIYEDSLVKCIIGPSTAVLERSLFEEVGGFREDLEVGEDYELWLRITPTEEVGYIDEPLTVKRAGHGEQLSEKYGHIEQFRIGALHDLVSSRFFLQDGGNYGVACDSLARIELARKCRIFANGARKRGRENEAEEYESLADSITQSL